MAYTINRHIERQNHLRAHSSEIQYVRALEQRGKLMRLDNVDVDVEQLLERCFQCDTQWCLKCKGKGADKEYKGSCCTDLQVDVTETEIERIRELGRRVEEKLDIDKKDPLYKPLRNMLKDDFHGTTDAGEPILAHNHQGRCSLSWIDTDGSLRCSINTMCQRTGLDLMYYKAEPCFLFPLHYVEYEPGRFFLTLISEETKDAIGADTHTARLKCLKKPQPGSPPAYEFLKYEIILCFGEALYDQLVKEAEARLGVAQAS